MRYVYTPLAAGSHGDPLGPLPGSSAPPQSASPPSSMSSRAHAVCLQGSQSTGFPRILFFPGLLLLTLIQSSEKRQEGEASTECGLLPGSVLAGFLTLGNRFLQRVGAIRVLSCKEQALTIHGLRKRTYLRVIFGALLPVSQNGPGELSLQAIPFFWKAD